VKIVTSIRERMDVRKALKAEHGEFIISPFKHPLQFLLLLVVAAAFTYAGVLIVAALYYMLFEVFPFMNHAWHSLVPSDDTRHLIRNVAEGLLGGLLGQAVTFNYYKKVVKHKPNLLDKFAMKLRIPTAFDDKLAGPFAISVNWIAVLVFAVPGFLFGSWFVDHLHTWTSWAAVHSSNPASASLLSRTESVVTSGYDQKIVGYFAAFVFGRRAALGVMSDVQERLASARIVTGRPLRWYHLPVFKARYNLLARQGVDPEATSGTVSVVLRVSMVAGALLAGFGYFVLNWVAVGLVQTDKLDSVLQYVEAFIAGVIASKIILWLGRRAYRLAVRIYRRIQEVPV
jgi:hypothetical protein